MDLIFVCEMFGVMDVGSILVIIDWVLIWDIYSDFDFMVIVMEILNNLMKLFKK